MSDETLSGWRRLTGATAAERIRSASLSMWGLAMLIATEAALFAALISSYFYLRWESDAGWPPDEIPDPKLLRPTALVAIIVASGAGAALAQLALRRGRPAWLSVWLATTFALGLAFLGIQIWDWVEKLKEFTPQTNSYGSLVYLLQGAHVAHLAVGLLVLAWVLVRALRGAYGRERRLGVAVAAMYWYFVVALGVAVYLTTTLSPYV